MPRPNLSCAAPAAYGCRKAKSRAERPGSRGAANMTRRAFTFPGQGSPAVGMGRALADAFPEARAVFDEVDEALGVSLANIMFEGPDDTLRLTENAQPALMAVSVAVVRVLETMGVSVGQ